MIFSHAKATVGACNPWGRGGAAPCQRRSGVRSAWSWLCWAVLAWLVVVPRPLLADAGNPLRLDASRPFPLSGHLEVRIDQERRLGFPEILADPGAFVSLSGNLARGYGAEAVWVRFQLIRTGDFPATAYLQLGPAWLDVVTVYVQTGEAADAVAAFRDYRLGDHLPAAGWPLPPPGFVVPLDLPLAAPRWVYVRIASTSSLGLYGAILPLGDLLSDTARSLFLDGGWVGITLIFALISAYFSIRLRDPLYAYYALLMLTMTLNRISAMGLLSLFWPVPAHRLADALVAAAAWALLFLALFVARLFAPELGARWRRFLLAVAAGPALAIALLGVAWGDVALPTIAIALLWLALATWLSLRRARAGGGWYYPIAYGVIVPVLTAEFLRMAGLAETAWWNIQALQVGILLHFILIGLALTEDARRATRRVQAVERNARREALRLAEDMTRDLRASEQALQETVDRQRQFVVLVSHEYRTPLAIIRANLDLLTMMKQDPDGNLAFATGKIKRAVARLVEVLEVSLEKVRLADEALTVQREPLLLQPFLNQLIEQARDYWPDRPLLLADAPAPAAIVLADPLLLRTALLNLLDNAVKYSPAGNPVRVCVQVTGAAADLTVADRGPGIPAEFRHKVLEKYYRIPDRGPVRGIGLGLYLVARIAAEHAGQVFIGDSEGGGATVTLRVPLAGEP